MVFQLKKQDISVDAKANVAWSFTSDQTRFYAGQGKLVVCNNRKLFVDGGAIAFERIGGRLTIFVHQVNLGRSGITLPESFLRAAVKMYLIIGDPQPEGSILDQDVGIHHGTVRELDEDPGPRQGRRAEKAQGGIGSPRRRPGGSKIRPCSARASTLSRIARGLLSKSRPPAAGFSGFR